MKHIKRRIKRLAGEAVRWAERKLPVNVLILLLLPIAVMRASYEWSRRNYFSKRSPKRRALLEAINNHKPRRSSPGKIWRSHVSLCLARFFRLWPDRLREPRWLKRCTFVGKDRLDAALSTNRPIILASVHFANVTEIYRWLRAKGYAIAILQHPVEGQDTSFRDCINTLADNANGLENVPHQFTPDQIWKVRGFLNGPGRMLGVAMDARHPRSILARGEVFGVWFLTGGLRFAAITNAMVIPCIIRATGCLRSEIFFGEPVPDELVASRDQPVEALEHILREISPWILENPEQCAPHFIRAIDLESPPVPQTTAKLAHSLTPSGNSP